MAEPGPLRLAWRRSRLTVLLCVVAGLVVMGALHVVRKAQYQAVAEVYIAEQDLNSLVLGVPISSDPQRDVSNDLQLAASVSYYQAVAAALKRPGFDYQSVQQNLSVTNNGLDDILKFTATGDTATRATQLANTAVGAYSTYRAQVLSGPIISSLADTTGTSADAKRLQLLSRLTRNAVIVSRAQTATPQATLSRDLSVGFIAGLVVGLLLMALREALPRLGPEPEPAVPPAPRDSIHLRRPSS
jgi:capsular polysaccharide biosynthesis protein